MLTRFADFTLDTETRQLATQAGAPIHLTPKAFDLLVLLVDAAPRVVAKAELHERLWAATFVSDATLAGLVKELRRALADTNRRAPVIRTAHGVGYALAVPVMTDPQRPGPAHWLVFDDRRVGLQPGANVVGRDPAADIWVNAAGVSRQHARILVGPDVFVEDLESKNGTRVRGERVTGPAAVQDGDGLEFGWVRCVYRSSSTDRSTETQSRRREDVAGSAEPSDG